MTTNQPFDSAQGTPDRIDQIADLLRQSIVVSNERMTRLEQMSEKTDARFNQLAEQQASLLAEADANREVTFMMLEQMTALQEESKRILDYLFGQQSNGKSDRPQP